MADPKIKLLENASATGAPVAWPGGKGSFMVEATFSGGTVSLEAQLPNGSWVAVGSSTTLSAAGIANFELAPCNIRAAIVTATAAYAVAVRIPQWQ